MCELKLSGLVALLMMIGSASVEAAPAFPPGADARAAQVNAKLPPQASAWIKQEAKREAASNTVSEAAALQAVRSAGPGLNLAGMSVEDAVLMMMMIISQDANDDMRQMLADMQRANAQKQAQRQAIEKQKAAQAAMKNQLRQEFPAPPAHPRIARSAALDQFLASERVSYDSLGDLGQEQQLKMQMALDRQSKANQIMSNMLKKISDTAQGITQNLK
jgi:hypothetical protein